MIGETEEEGGKAPQLVTLHLKVEYKRSCSSFVRKGEKIEIAFFNIIVPCL